MDISIIYVNYNVERLLLSSIKSIYKSFPKAKFEIIVVDNSQNKSLSENLARINKKIIYINPKNNLGFGRANNLGAKKAKGKCLLFLNPDTKVFKYSIDLMFKYLESNKRVGVLGPKIVSKSGVLLPSISSNHTRINTLVIYSFIMGIWRKNPFSRKFLLADVDRSKTLEVDVVSGSCMLIPKRVFEKVRGFDKNFFMYFEEHDLCVRVKESGYKVVYFPEAKITHLIGQSMKDKNVIKKYFEKSRYYYSRKYFGMSYALFSEFFLRYFSLNSIIFLLVFLFSFYLNTYGIDKLMIFIGDVARDFLIAKEVISSQMQIPIVGIPSSVTWLHQGPLAQWVVILSLWLTNFNATAPAIIFGFINAVSSGLIFVLGKRYFNRFVGILAAILYISAPVIVVNARMPYHTSLVPFFSLLLFMLLPSALKDVKKIPLSGFLLGLLLLVELSNIVVIGVIAILILSASVKIKPSIYLRSFFALILGLFPFVLYDLQNGPTYLKFPLWIGYRVFKSFAGGGVSSNGLITNSIMTVYQQVAGSIVPSLPLVAILFFVSSVIYLSIHALKSKALSHKILILWIVVPLLGFVVHRTPGTAYFALIYPAIVLSIALFSYKVFGSKASLLIVLTLFAINTISLFANSFYINTNDKNNYMPPSEYSYGNTYLISLEASKAITKDARNESVFIKPYGTTSLYETSLDPYKYFLNDMGININKNSKNIYYILEDDSKIPGTKIIYKNRLVEVRKDE